MICGPMRGLERKKPIMDIIQKDTQTDIATTRPTRPRGAELEPYKAVRCNVIIDFTG